MVSENEPLYFKPVSRVIPFGIDIVWEYLTDPAQRQRWQEGVHSISRARGDPHRLRTGAVEHCAHGKESIVINYVDVRPLKHMTGEVLMPLGGKMRFSLLTTAESKGTRVTARFAQPQSPSSFVAFLLRQLVGFREKRAAILVEVLRRYGGTDPRESGGIIYSTRNVAGGAQIDRSQPSCSLTQGWHRNISPA